jgi:hypothetical protein
MAILLHADVLVVPETGPVYAYPKETGLYNLQGTNHVFYSDKEGSIVCYDETHTAFIPEFAFDPETIVICYNAHGMVAGTHFWCTRLLHDAPSWPTLLAACPVPVRRLLPVR